MKYLHRLFAVASAAFFFAGSALAQNAGTVTNHAYAIGKGAGTTGFTSMLCTSAQLAVGQAAADPICQTITGDVTISAAGVTAIGATKVTSAMLNADVFSTAHSWAGQQTFVAPILGTPASGTLTNATGLPISTGVSGLGTGVATALVNVLNASGGLVGFSGALGTPASGTATNLTGTAAGLTAGNATLAATVTTNANLTGDVTSVGNTTTLTNAPVIAKVLTGFTSGAGTVSAADSILAALQKINGNDALKAPLARNLSTGCGLTGGGDLSADRTLKLSLLINPQVGTSYTVVDGDCSKLVTLNNAAAVAVSLPQANGSTFVSGWSVDFQNRGAGIATVTPVTSTINGGASIALAQNQGMHCQSDGTNYSCMMGVGAGGGAGTVTQVVCGTGLSGGTITASGTCAVSLTNISNSLGADVLLNNTANYFDGPSVAQGVTGTWFASGTVTLVDTAAAQIVCKLWDGTTVVASSFISVNAGSGALISLSGNLTTPAANIRISCRDLTNTTGLIKFNLSGNSKDSTLTVFRIQ